MRGLREWGRSWQQVGDRIGMKSSRVWQSAQYGPKRKRKHKAAVPIVKTGEPWQERVAAAYGMTWQQLQAIRAAGLTVKQFREMAAERSA